MKKMFLSLGLLGLALQGAAAGQDFMREERSMTVDGRQRDYIVYTPRGLAPGRKLPLVFGLHGGYGKGETFEQTARLHEAEGARHFMFVYPSGYRRSWNAGNCCGQAAGHQVDDTRFFRMLIARLSEQGQADEKRVFFTGFSNGAMMTYRLACDMAGQITAVAPVGAGMALPLEDCRPERPVPVLHMHGSLDGWAPFKGGASVREKAPPQMAIPDVIAAWKSLNACKESGSTELVAGAACSVQRECSNNADVNLCVVDGLGHQWPGDAPPERLIKLFGAPAPAVKASDAILAFFRRYL